MEAYGDGRFASGGRIWGESPSRTAVRAAIIFQGHGVKNLLIPGAGYGRHVERVEENTFESKPGRPVHFFTEPEMRSAIKGWAVLEAGLTDDPEDHGDAGPHTHRVRYVCAQKPDPFA